MTRTDYWQHPPGLSQGIVHYGGQTFRNYTIGPGYCLLTWSIYEGQDRLDVPMLEVVSHVLLVMSILSVLVLIWFRKRPTKELLLQDSWGTVRVSDCAIRLYNFVGMADLLMAILTLLLMTAPIPHEDDFAHWVYTCARAALARHMPPSRLTRRPSPSPSFPVPPFLFRPPADKFPSPLTRSQRVGCSTTCRGSAACTTACLRASGCSGQCSCCSSSSAFARVPSLASPPSTT